MQPDLLQQLKDLHLPQVPGWWPPAPGWWILAALLVAAFIGSFIVLRRRMLRQRPYKVARAELERLGSSFDAGRLTAADLAHATSALLKRALIAAEGRRAVARLEGDAWLAHLDGVAGEGTFTRGPGALLGVRRFDPDGSGDAARLVTVVEKLLRKLERGP